MARTKNTAVEETKVNKTTVVNEKATEAVDKGVKNIPANVEKLMKLYPQYESFYVTSTGFVHPVEAPEYLVKDAALYKNKYFKK